MGLRMREKRAVIAVTAEKYRKARKKEKGAILEQLIELTGYAKRYVAWLLRHHGKRTAAGKMMIVGDVGKKTARKLLERLYYFTFVSAPPAALAAPADQKLATEMFSEGIALDHIDKALRLGSWQ